MIGNDHWTLDIDALGMTEAGDALARLVLTCRPPYAVVVQGKWGSGKTSLMRYAMARLGGAPLATTLRTVAKPVEELPEDLGAGWKKLAGDSTVFIEETIRRQLVTPPTDLLPHLQIVPVWFNAWQHQGTERPIVALLHELREQFTFLLKAKGRIKKLSSVAVEAGLPILAELADAFASLPRGSKTGLGSSLGRVRGVAEAYEKRHFEARHDAQRLQLLFEEAVDRLLRRDNQNRKAFKDGHQGPVALRRLVIFVDDLDRCAEAQTVHLLEAIKLYLQTKNCVFVVGMDSTAARRAVAKVLGQDGETAHEYLEKLFQTTFAVPAPRARDAFAAELLKYHELPRRKGLAGKICDLAEPNPRKLKSFVAGLAAGWSVYGADRGEEEIELFLLLHYLRSYHPDVYRLLSYDPEQVATLWKVLAEGLEQMEPGASSVAYFFLAAFEHAAEAAFGDQEEVTREGRSAVVSQLTRRLDRHKGDRAFIALWQSTLKDGDGADAVARLRPFLELMSPEDDA